MTQYQTTPKSKLSEGLRFGDLVDTVDPLFTVDQYQSKMGKDQDVLVLKFRVFDKEPAIDLMEFIEKGYSFVLDADISSGEEKDGNYSVFVELERNLSASDHIENLLSDIGKLCKIENWKFCWYKNKNSFDFDIETFSNNIPLTANDYVRMSHQLANTAVIEFFNQGALENVKLDENRNIQFTKMFSGPLTAKLVAFGEYNELKNLLPGNIQLDESSRHRVLYLNKYLGNYDINKINDHYLIRNDKLAIIITKDIW
jgi:hypothetical protein